MPNNVCRSCGYTFKREDTVCKYCGSSNPSYVQPRIKPTFTRTYEDKTDFTVTTNSTNKKDSEMNVCLLIFLIVAFWPAALIYAIIKLKK